MQNVDVYAMEKIRRSCEVAYVGTCFGLEICNVITDNKMSDCTG